MSYASPFTFRAGGLPLHPEADHFRRPMSTDKSPRSDIGGGKFPYITRDMCKARRVVLPMASLGRLTPEELRPSGGASLPSESRPELRQHPGQSGEGESSEHGDGAHGFRGEDGVYPEESPRKEHDQCESD
jgi:hypothetical protein